MSPADDRIPVPTNGHARPLDGPASPGLAAPPSALPAPPPAPAPTIAFTLGQLAVGFGILASIVLLLLGRRRRRRP